MGNRTSTKSKRYRIKDDTAEIKVTNVVGAGQPGGWSMSLDGIFLAQSTEEKTSSVGIGADLVFTELRIEFVLHDMQWQHDRLTATTIVTGGGGDKLEITHEQQGERGDSATYTTLVQFV